MQRTCAPQLTSAPAPTTLALLIFYLDKLICQFRQIQFAIYTNTIIKLDKYNLQSTCAPQLTSAPAPTTLLLQAPDQSSTQCNKNPKKNLNSKRRDRKTEWPPPPLAETTKRTRNYTSSMSWFPDLTTWHHVSLVFIARRSKMSDEIVNIKWVG